MEDNVRDIYAYDNLITMALALNASIKYLQSMSPPRTLQQFSYEDTDTANVLLENAGQTDFVGLTVSITYFFTILLTVLY